MTDWEDKIAPEWEEPRGPHLPDALTGVPLGVWPFVAVASLFSYLELQRYGPNSIGNASDLMSIALSLTPTVAPPLSGAVLFLRHPHAWSRHRRLAIALGLLTAGVAIQFIAPALFDLIEPSGPLVDPFAELAPSQWYWFVSGIASSFVSVVGVAYLCFGLDRERRQARSRSSLWIFVVLAVGSSVMTILSVPSYLAFGVISGDSQYLLHSTARIALWLVGYLAWAAVATVAVDGARMGERPRSAWWLVAVAGLGTSIVAVGIEAVLGLMVNLIGENQALTWLFAAPAFVPNLALLAAFALGLPSMDELGIDASETPIPNA